MAAVKTERWMLMKEAIEACFQGLALAVLSKATPLGLEDGTLTLEMACKPHAEMMENPDRKAALLVCLRAVDQTIADIKFPFRTDLLTDQPPLLDVAPTATPPSVSSPSQPATHHTGQTGKGERFVLIEPPRFHAYHTFEDMLVHEGNATVIGEARRIAATDPDARRTKYMFVVGKTGTGKTCLLHAIGNELREKRPELAIVLLNGKRFAEEVGDSFKHRTTSELKARFRGVDVLLVDAAHGIFPGYTGKFGDVFFEIVEALEDQEVQVVMASEVLPDKLNITSEAMRSRIESGVCQLLPPSREAKVKYIDFWQQRQDVVIGDDTAKALADAPNSDFRILSAALAKLCADDSLHGVGFAPAAVDAAVEVARLHGGKRKISYEDVATHVTDVTSVTLTMMRGKGQEPRIANARRLFCYLSCELVDTNQSEAARYLGKDHSSVSGWMSTMRTKMKQDRGYASSIESMIASLKG